MPRRNKDHQRPEWARALLLRRMHLDRTQEEVAALGGDLLSQGTVSDLEQGRINLNRLETPRAVALARGLDWTLFQLQDETGVDLGLEASVRAVPLPRDLTGPTRKIPVFLDVSAGPGAEDGELVEEIDIPANWLGDYAGYRVTGDSMEPDVPRGSTVVARLQDHARLGQVVVAYVPGRGMVVKKLAAVTPEHEPVLASKNPNYAELIAEGARIIGVVREMRKLFD